MLVVEKTYIISLFRPENPLFHHVDRLCYENDFCCCRKQFDGAATSLHMNEKSSSIRIFQIVTMFRQILTLWRIVPWLGHAFGREWWLFDMRWVFILSEYIPFTYAHPIRRMLTRTNIHI